MRVPYKFRYSSILSSLFKLLILFISFREFRYLTEFLVAVTRAKSWAFQSGTSGTNGTSSVITRTYDRNRRTNWMGTTTRQSASLVPCQAVSRDAVARSRNVTERRLRSAAAPRLFGDQYHSVMKSLRSTIGACY